VRRALVGTALLLLLPDLAAAWPAETMTALGRDARRLLPRSLSRLLGERETKILLELRKFPPAVGQALARDIPAGELRPETLAALEYEADRAVEMLREGQVSQGLVRMGALLRIPADLSDPILSGVPEGWPPGVTREYYALLAAHFDQMPVVLDEPKTLEVGRAGLPRLWQSLLARSRPQATVIHRELFRDGRLVDHRRLDYRSPAWAVAVNPSTRVPSRSKNTPVAGPGGLASISARGLTGVAASAVTVRSLRPRAPVDPHITGAGTKCRQPCYGRAQPDWFNLWPGRSSRPR